MRRARSSASTPPSPPRPRGSVSRSRSRAPPVSSPGPPRAAASSDTPRHRPTLAGNDEVPMHLLLVEDDERLARALTRLLEEDRHVVEHASDGRTGIELATALDGLDAVILDIGLPDMSGLDVARAIRSEGVDVSILMLTARDTVNDRVTGLDAGPDDYAVKPFAYQEVSARLRALARRAVPGPRRAQPKLKAGVIELDEASRRVTVNGSNVYLSPREFSLLEALLRHAGITLTRDQLLDHAWPFSVAVTPNAVDAYVHYLRTKLGDAGSQIETVRGVGYRLADG